MPPLAALAAAIGPYLAQALIAAGLAALQYGLQSPLGASPIAVQLSTADLAPRRPAVSA